MILAHNNYSSRTHPFFRQQTHGHLDAIDSDTSNYSTSSFQSASGLDSLSRRSTTNSQSLSQVPDLMPSSESWLVQNQQTPRAAHRLGHNRESSWSSLNSNGPASPYAVNTSNPHIAVTDSNDGFHDLSGGDGHFSYQQLGKPTMSENYYATLQSLSSSQGTNAADLTFADGLPNLSAPQQQQQQQKRFDRGLQPAADLSSVGSATKSHSASVASSTVGGDSPATPSFHEPAEDEHRRRKNASNANMPKLDRTMTDVYSDELYSPHFTITSASPPPQTQLAMSPNNETFARALNWANNHLSTGQSPVSSTSRHNSPFRQGSPLAPSLHDFPSQQDGQVRLNTAQQIREQQKQERDAKALQQQLARNVTQQQSLQQSTPSTISPKDAMLDFNEVDDASNFPLFPSQESNNFDLQSMTKPISQTQAQAQGQTQTRTPLQTAFDFSMPTNIQIPQQYPFVSRPRQQQMTPSVSNFSRMSSADTSGSGMTDGPVQRPAKTNADGGTYTCTYHGCTQRFETPQLLQKHKREGHRQANALSTARSPVVVTTSGLPDGLIGSQAGPHRCDRINPSTGKPCSTVFSRPYDLTRHEDTIHNARKKKVRCNLCTEEKTFSRADALTRHYRVCHPDVEFPGKHRRRGGSAI